MERELNQQEENCLKLLERSGQPETVIAHCKRVADIAEKLAFLLNAYGYSLDVSLCFRAGLLHDIRRTKPRHSAFGARYLRAVGLEPEADICEKHMGEGINPDEVSETTIVCLADKICGSEGIISTEARFLPGLEKYKLENPEAVPSILERMNTCVKLEENISSILGGSLGDFL